jgi:hypothetical protein
MSRALRGRRKGRENRSNQPNYTRNKIQTGELKATLHNLRQLQVPFIFQ